MIGHTFSHSTEAQTVFTNDHLVRGALEVLEPLYSGENPLEPERVSEKLHAHRFQPRRAASELALSVGLPD